MFWISSCKSKKNFWYSFAAFREIYEHTRKYICVYIRITIGVIYMYVCILEIQRVFFYLKNVIEVFFCGYLGDILLSVFPVIVTTQSLKRKVP